MAPSSAFTALALAAQTDDLQGCLKADPMCTVPHQALGEDPSKSEAELYLALIQLAGASDASQVGGEGRAGRSINWLAGLGKEGLWSASHQCQPPSPSLPFPLAGPCP